MWRQGCPGTLGDQRNFEPTWTLVCPQPGGASAALASEVSPLTCGLLSVIFPPVLGYLGVRPPPVLLPVPTRTPTPPTGLVLLTHVHVQRVCRDGKPFTSAAGQAREVATQNGEFRRAEDMQQLWR